MAGMRWSLALVALVCIAITAVHAQRVVPRGSTPITSKKLVVRGTPNPAAAADSKPQRVTPKPRIAAKQMTEQQQQQAAAGTALPGEYIVLFDGSSDVTAASASTVEAAVTAVAAAMASGEVVAAASDTPESLVTTLSVSAAPAGTTGIPSQMVLRVPAELAAEQVRTQLSAVAGVQAVVQNIVVRIAQGSCSAPSFAGGVVVKPAAGLTMTWQGCLGSNLGTALAMFGERCGNSADKFRWTGIFAYSTATGQLYNNCVALRSAETDATKVANMYGSCGVAPAWFPAVPTAVCMETSSPACIQQAALPAARISLTSRFCGATSITFAGVPCGPNGALVQWNKMTPGSLCSSVSRDATTGDLKKQADWLGQCGVSPAQIQGLPTRICGKPATDSAAQPAPLPSPSPSPAPSPSPSPSPSPEDSISTTPPPTTQLPTTAMAAGENPSYLWGMARIGAYDSASNTVVDASAAIDATGFKVIVMDTGCETTHPDLNVVEFNDFAEASTSPTYGKDGHGHGTHVAGTIGAKNNGAGVFGVVPGMPIIAYKVLGADGSGSLANSWNAYRAILARLQAGEKIAAINLSLGAVTTDVATRNMECDLVRQIAAYGVAVVAAAGNDNGASLETTIPAACPDATVVTSIASGDVASSFSNLAYTSSPQAMKDRMIAAPGSTITSTYKDNTYGTMSGTSMATPHVTGAYAKCFLSGACRLSSSPDTPAAKVNIPVMQAAAKASSCSSCPQFATSNYYGYVLNVRLW